MIKTVAVIGVKGFPAFGGSARANESIASRLKESYRFVFYVLDSHHDKNYVIGDSKFIILKSVKNRQLSVLAYYWKAMFHALVWGKYDLIQMNHYSSGLTIPFLRMRYTVVSTLRGILGKYDVKFGLLVNIYLKIAEIAFFKFSNHLISVSQSQIAYANRFTAKQISHIPNGIDIETPIDTEGVFDEKNYLLFSAARIYEIKGCHLFLEAVHLLGLQHKILIVGDLNQVVSYKEKILKLSQGLEIKFIPIIKDKKKLFGYLKNALLYVFPSFIEGMSNMLLEVASCQIPIVASDIPANTSVFNDDEVLYFSSGNAMDLAQKIRWALDHDERMRQKAATAFKKLQKNYSWEKVAEKYNTLYKKILAGRVKMVS